MRRLSRLFDFCKQFKKTLIAVGVLFVCYFGFLTHLEPKEVGIGKNWLTGEFRLLTAGFWFSPPWETVAHIDTRPTRLVASSTGRAYSAKLVQFDETAWREFVDTEGWRYYWLDNRLSFNWGFHEECRGIHATLRGYAFSHKKYAFLKVMEEY